MREDMTTLKDQGTAIVDKACGLQSSEGLSDGVGAHEVSRFRRSLREVREFIVPLK